jgi:hypothetical protein
MHRSKPFIRSPRQTSPNASNRVMCCYGARGYQIVGYRRNTAEQALEAHSLHTDRAMMEATSTSSGSGGILPSRWSAQSPLQIYHGAAPLPVFARTKPTKI